MKVTVYVAAVLLGESAAAFCASPTFNKDIAPVVYEHCSICHRPGGSAPFALLSYAAARKRARQLAEVTERRYMPPWPPEGPVGEFLGERRLSPAEIELFKRWFQAGAPEGSSGDLPPAPVWPEGWQLGKPDLVVSMPGKFTLAAEGQDVYRNFVIPVGLDALRYVRAVEFRADNPRVVHHAFVKIDGSGQARKLDGVDGQPGFDGMNLPDGVHTAEGYFLSYQPGKMPSAELPGFGWSLKPKEDFVVQTHLKPTGKPESLQVELGLFFTDIPPTNLTTTLALSSLNIDIPTGDQAWVLEDRFLMPVDADVMSVLPHAHYLGKRLEGFAHLPDGSTRQLISIPDWDFNWQGDYRYARPIHLPAGTELEMRFSYDNSAQNPRNPNHPPREVLYGAFTSDEMGELWFQLRLNNPEDAARLKQAYNDKNLRMFASYAEFRLARNPRDARARTELGFTQWTSGRVAEAMETFRQACADDPTYDQPHYYRGVVYRIQKHLTAARTEFQVAVRLNPKNSQAFGNLAFVFLDLGNLGEAEKNIREAVRLDPTDALAGETLARIERLRDSSKTPVK